MIRLRARASISILLVTFALAATACDQQAATPAPTSLPAATAPRAGGLTVFAAASLKDVFGAMAEGLKAKGLADVTYNFAGSQVLATQLGQGARADVFASADARTMDLAVQSGAVVTGTQQLLATNKLVVITPLGDAAKVKSLTDLVKPGTKIVIADETVPAGDYTLQALRKLSADKAQGGDFQKRVLSNVVSRETNVRQVFAKVQLGEADAGFVYYTDTAPPEGFPPPRSGRPIVLTVGMVDIPDDYNVVARYYIAPLKDAPNPQGAKAFTDFALSPDGKQILERFGFGTADATK